MHQWSTVIFKPSIWWRIKYLFKPHSLIFCWGDDKWMTQGFTGETYLSIGGVPDSMRHRLPKKD